MKRAYSQNTNTYENQLMRVPSGLRNSIYSRMKQIIFIAAIVFLFASCNRDMVFDTKTVTEPSLTVVVETQTGSGSTITYTKVNGAVVNLFNNETDFNANATPFKSKTTGQDGKANFTKTELVQKGVFYIKVTSGTLSGSVTTAYLLLNDGETLIHITLN